MVDPTSGRVDLRYNPMSIEEDYFIPVRAGSATEITNLAGGQNTTQIDDIKYLRDKLFSALKIPQAYLAMGEGAGEDKTTLAQKDIRFARTIQRLQRVIIAELEKIGIIHLYTLGFRGDDLLSFSLSLNNPSKIAELQEIEHWKAKFDIAASATEGFFSRRWVSENIFGMSYEDFIRNQREMYYDRKQDASLQAVAEQAAAGDAAGGLGGGLGADLGGGLGGDLSTDPADPGAGGPEEMPAGNAEPAAGGDSPDAAGGADDSPLLAVPPGSRDVKTYEKGGTYKPVDFDRRSDSGPRIKNYAAKRSAEKSSATMRNVFPGSEINSIPSIAKGIYEQEDPIYNLKEQNEEIKLFNVNESVRNIIESLENNNMLMEQNDNEKKTQ